jgi:hypothetical protein
MHKRITLIFAVMVNLFYNLISYANNTEDKLEYKVNNATENIMIAEKTSQQKTYKFGINVNYSLDKLDISHRKNYNSLNSYSIWKKICNSNAISNITRVGIATSFVDVISISENTNKQFTKDNSQLNNQQLNSTKQLLLLLDEIQQKGVYLFIPELIPMLINWGKINQIDPLVTIEAIKVSLYNPNEIVFKFNLSTIVDYLYFIKPEDQQYLSKMHGNIQKKIFNIKGDCKINFKSNQKEFRLLTTSGQVLLHLQTIIEDKNLLSATINDMQNNISFVIKNECKIKYEYNTKESIPLREHEDYVLINDLNSNYSMLSNMYNLYLTKSNKKIKDAVSTLPLSLDSIDNCMSLQEICTESINNTRTIQNKQYDALNYLLSEIQAANYKLFIPDLIPIIKKWHKTGIIYPLVIIDKKHINYTTNEAIIEFHIEQMLSSWWFNNTDDLQYLSISKYNTSLYNFKIAGVCKINLQTTKRMTYLLNNSGKIIYTSEYTRGR